MRWQRRCLLDSNQAPGSYFQFIEASHGCLLIEEAQTTTELVESQLTHVCSETLLVLFHSPSEIVATSDSENHTTEDSGSLLRDGRNLGQILRERIWADCSYSQEKLL